MYDSTLGSFVAAALPGRRPTFARSSYHLAAVDPSLAVQLHRHRPTSVPMAAGRRSAAVVEDSCDGEPFAEAHQSVSWAYSGALECWAASAVAAAAFVVAAVVGRPSASHRT